MNEYILMYSRNRPFNEYHGTSVFKVRMQTSTICYRYATFLLDGRFLGSVDSLEEPSFYLITASNLMEILYL